MCLQIIIRTATAINAASVAAREDAMARALDPHLLFQLPADAVLLQIMDRDAALAEAL